MARRNNSRRAKARAKAEASEASEDDAELLHTDEQVAERAKPSSEAAARGSSVAEGSEAEAYLQADGLPRPLRDAGDRAARRVFVRLREACQLCSYRRLCSFAPVALHVQRTRVPQTQHTHKAILRRGLRQLVAANPRWYLSLLNIMAEREGDGHLAGCLLAEAWRRYPERMADLLDEVKQRSAPLLAESPHVDAGGHARKLQPGQGVDPRAMQARVFRGQLVRAAAFLEDEALFHSVHDSLGFDPDEDGRLYQHELVAALTLFIIDDVSAREWVESLEERSPEPFRATFAWKLYDEDIIAMFFPYRRGNKRSYLFLSRGADGGELLTSIDKQPVQDVLINLFAVLDSDEKKTYRIFKELCRHINVRAGQYNADAVLEGFAELEREELLLLAIYAPALARAIGHFLGLSQFDRLVKFLYRLRAQGGRRGAPLEVAHAKVFEARGDWEALRSELGEPVVKELFKLLFRLNASYQERVYTTNTFIKLGEAAYLLTALAGWNPKGLDLELASRKPLAYIAYGLQPPNKWSALRARKFGRVRARYGDEEELWRALEIGGAYMAKLHDFGGFEELHNAACANDSLEADVGLESRGSDEVRVEASSTFDVVASELEEDDDVVPPPPRPMRSSEEPGPEVLADPEGRLLDSSLSGSGLFPRRDAEPQLQPASPPRSIVRKRRKERAEPRRKKGSRGRAAGGAERGAPMDEAAGAEAAAPPQRGEREPAKGRGRAGASRSGRPKRARGGATKEGGEAGATKPRRAPKRRRSTRRREK